MKFLYSNLLMIALAGYAHAFEPWSISKQNPVIEEISQRSLQKTFAFDYGFYFWKNFLTHADGARCGMYPTCSHYAVQAVQKHGPILGGWMATDRLMRDHGRSPQFYEWIDKLGKTYLYDPVSYNDFWIYNNNENRNTP